jgi:D-beta-D-heptose 7-phosphate kinase/D-beta-D-heptose 1-phosphate adenosyltransferase
MNSNFNTDIKNKIVSLHDLEIILNRLRSESSPTVVFTNGCFDLVHRGHVDYLSRARDLGDLLIVGLNSDASVQRLKGPQRPVSHQESRAIVMAAFSFVDYVVIFDEDTPLRLIETVRPDILVKGGDYTRDNVVGADFVESYGGRLELLSLVPGESTTRLVERMKL